MKIDDFKGRTCNTITWTLILTIIFFIVCFVAVNDFSENSIYDEKKAYNLIKDTFLFAGTILTPLVAVFFFHDWREQHVAKELESKSQKLYMSIKKVHDKLVELSVEIDDENNLKKDSRSKIDSEFSNVFNQINHLEYCIEGININSKTKEFVDFASDIVDELR